MSTRTLGLMMGFAVMLAGSTASAGQHDEHQAATADGQATAQVAQCRQAQPRVAATIAAALKRLDGARQTNSPAVMRAAADDLQSALLDVRLQLMPCADMQVAAADVPAGHTMPNVQPPSTATPAPEAAGAPIAQQAAPSRQAPQPAAGRTNAPSITFRTIPSPPRGAAENELEVTVKDSQGKPIDGAEVTVLFYMAAMPSMKMPEMRNEVKLKGAGNGTYTGKGQIMMAGSWTVTVTVKQNGKEIGQQKVAIAAK